MFSNPDNTRGTLGDLRFCGDYFFASYNNRLAYSRDLINWTEIVETTFKYGGRGSDRFGVVVVPGIECFAYGNGHYIIGGSDGMIAYSTDKDHWTAVKDSTFSTATQAEEDRKGTILEILYGGDKFVAVGHGGKAAYSEDDGKTWTAYADTTFARDEWILDLAYGKGRFVAVGHGGKIAYTK
jgi:hypothetical protein